MTDLSVGLNCYAVIQQETSRSKKGKDVKQEKGVKVKETEECPKNSACDSPKNLFWTITIRTRNIQTRHKRSLQYLKSGKR